MDKVGVFFHLPCWISSMWQSSLKANNGSTIELYYEEHMKFLLFAIVMLYKVALKPRLANTETLLLREIQDWGAWVA